MTLSKAKIRTYLLSENPREEGTITSVNEDPLYYFNINPEENNTPLNFFNFRCGYKYLNTITYYNLSQDSLVATWLHFFHTEYQSYVDNFYALADPAVLDWTKVPGVTISNDSLYGALIPQSVYVCHMYYDLGRIDALSDASAQTPLPAGKYAIADTLAQTENIFRTISAHELGHFTRMKDDSTSTPRSIMWKTTIYPYPENYNADDYKTMRLSKGGQ